MSVEGDEVVSSVTASVALGTPHALSESVPVRHVTTETEVEDTLRKIDVDNVIAPSSGLERPLQVRGRGSLTRDLSR